MTVGLIVDSAASEAQAISAIASGEAGGPMAMLAPLVGRFGGVERAKADIRRTREKWTAKAGDLIDQECEGILNMEGRALVIDNASHPVKTRLAMARAVRSIFNAFGIGWKDDTGTRNGHYAPFSWSG